MYIKEKSNWTEGDFICHYAHSILDMFLLQSFVNKCDRYTKLIELCKAFIIKFCVEIAFVYNTMRKNISVCLVCEMRWIDSWLEKGTTFSFLLSLSVANTQLQRANLIHNWWNHWYTLVSKTLSANTYISNISYALP